MKTEHKLSLVFAGWCADSFDSEGELHLIINGIDYFFNGITFAQADKIEWQIKKGYNKGRILKNIEKMAGKGRKTGQDWMPVKIILAEIMQKLKPKEEK